MSKINGSVIKAVDDYNMLENGDTVIVALSGGADSVSLLNILISLKENYSISLKAVHLNHNLRGEESLRDEKFVRKICREKDVELFVKSLNIKEIASQKKISTELAGRNERYKYFEELSEKYGAKIATAHTADDNAETVIFNLMRGTGLNGICGIKPVRGNIIRPLIYLSREEIEEFCRENSLEYVTDSTNLSDDYTRNKIRHSIIPLMRDFNPNFISAITDETRIFNDINSYIELKADEAIKNCACENGYDCKALKSLPDGIKPSVIYALCRKNNVQPEYKHISLILSILDFGAVDLNGNIRAVSKQGTLRFVNTENENDDFSEIELKLPMAFDFNEKKYSVKEIKNKTPKNAIKLSLIENNPVFRTRRAKDTFTLPKRRVTKSLKKLFNEFKIPDEKRNKILLLADGNDILWIEGIGVSEKALSKGNTGFVIEIEN